MKKKFEKISHKVFGLLTSVLMVVNIFAPTVTVLAETYGSGSQSLSVGVDSNENEFTVDSITVNGNTWESNQDKFLTDDGNYDIVIKVQEKEEVMPNLVYGGNFNDYVTKKVTNEDGIYTYTLTVRGLPNSNDYSYLSLNLEANQNDNQGSQGGDQGQGNTCDRTGYKLQFDGAQMSGNNLVYNGYDLQFGMMVTDGEGTHFDSDPENVCLESANEGKDYVVYINTDDISKYYVHISNNYPNELYARIDGNKVSISQGNISLVSLSDTSKYYNVAFETEQGGGEPGPQECTGDCEEATINYTFTGSGADFSINGYDFRPNESNLEKTDNGGTFNNIPLKYAADGDTVTFNFETLWLYKITKLKINDVDYSSKLPSTSKELASAYSRQHISVKIDGVTKSSTYNIETTTKELSSDEIFIGNFLWENDESKVDMSDPEKVDDLIGEGTLSFVKAEYDGKTYNSVQEVNEAGNLFEWSEGVKTDHDPEGTGGGATFPVGTKLTVKLIPNAGYQLTSFGVNGGKFEPQEEVGTYTFTILPGNGHLAASFTKVDDEVNAKSDKVESGSITLGGSEKSMSNGTARLDVEDANLTSAQKSSFEEAASGYSIKDYLDISLYNTIYKGSEKDAWDTQVKDLDNKATITLKLEDGVDGDNVVIVHEKHDGTYEIIETTYDASNHTITFVTDSFSNYAIATKTSVKAEDSSSTNDKNAAKEVNLLVDKILNGGTVSGISAALASKVNDSVNNGETLTTELAATEVSSIDADELALVQKKMTSGSKVLGYFDIDLLLKANGTTLGNVTELENAISVTIDINDLLDSLDKVKNGYNRVFKVVRIHDDEATLLDATLNSDGTLTFKTDKFSTYVITYQDVKASSNTSSTTSSSVSNPSTNDGTVIYIVLFALSATLLTSGYVLRRKLVK